MLRRPSCPFFFFFNDTATTEIYTLSLHDALPILIAWDAGFGKKVWEIKEKYPVWSGALVTAGGVVFYGTLDGWFKAGDAKSGAALWKFKVGSGVVGNPITFTGPAGKQDVAVYAGL